ncbi:MAG: alcohol dehydrogenase catalytic domain-containing protein [Acidobacteriota bacterium]
MLGLWLEDGVLGLREDLPVPEPAAGEALVRVSRAGICNTDLELVRGYLPFTGIPGHEFVGRVVSGPAGLLGRRVVGEINAVCHQCASCRAGRARHCEQRTVLGIAGRWGAFADFLTLPAENLHPLPETIGEDEGVFVEPTAAALEVQRQVPVGPGCRVLVVGDGKLGHLIARTLALTGCELLVLGRHRRTLGLLRQAGIATGWPGTARAGSFDLAVECTGHPEGFDLARRALRPCGTLVLKSTYAGALSLEMSSLVVDEITLVGSRCGPFSPALELLAGGRLDVAPLLEAHYPLHAALEAFEHAGRPGMLKVILEGRGTA